MDGSHGNESLTYKAPKQPKKQKGKWEEPVKGEGLGEGVMRLLITQGVGVVKNHSKF